jgi:hypothetical protein
MMPTNTTGGVYWLRVQTAQGAHYAQRVVLAINLK